jgi:hypothetical protein
MILPKSTSEASYIQAKDNLKSTFGNLSMGVDPTAMKDMAVVGTWHFKKGLRTFVNWSKAMIKDLGERARQFLRPTWRNVRVQKDIVDNETALDNEAASLSKIERSDKEMQVSRMDEGKRADVSDIAEVNDIFNKFNTHNPYNVIHDKDGRDRIQAMFSDIKDEDMGFWSRMSSLPWWKAKKFREWAKIMGIEIKRSEDKNLLKVELGQSVFDTYEGDARNIEFTNKELEEGVTLDELGIQHDDLTNKKIKLNPDEIRAYRAFQVTMRKSRVKVMDLMEELVFRPYQEQPWVDDLKKLVRDKEAARFEYNKGNGLVEDREEINANEEISDSDIPENLDAKQRVTFLKAFERTFKPKITIENLRRRMGKIKGYAPRLRPEGTFKIDVFNAEGRKIFSDIQPNERKAQAKARELVSKYEGRGQVFDQDFTMKVENVKRTPEFLYQQISATGIERFMSKALDRVQSKENITQEELDTIRESMTEAMADELKERGFGRHMMKRRRGRAVGGYKVEGGRKILAGYIGGMAGFITKQRAAYDFGQALSDIDVAKKPVLYEELTTYTRNMLRNQTRADLVSSQIRTGAFLWYLSGQLKSPMVNLTQNWILGIPTLGKFTKGARRKYHRAMFDVARGGLSTEEQKAMKEAEERGITSDQLMQDILGETLSQAGKAYSSVIKVLSFPFSLSEKYNRQASFLARYRAGLEKGESHQVAFDGARNFVFDVHFLYGKENQALIATGGTPFNNVVRTSLTFRNFTFNYLNAIKHHLGDANLALVGRSLAYLTLLGGLSSVPFVDDWLDMLERLTGVSFRKQIQKELKGIGGDMLAEVGTFGLPALVGADLSGSLRIKFPDITDPGQLFQESAFGVYGGVATKGADAVKNLIDGKALKAFEAAAPVAIEKPLKSVRLFKEGATTKSGKTIFSGSGKPLQVSLREAITQGLGFRPGRLAFESGKFRQFRNVEGFFKNRRAALFRQFRTARSSSDRQEIFQAIREYNREARKLKGAVPLITTKSFKRALREKPSKRFAAFLR